MTGRRHVHHELHGEFTLLRVALMNEDSFARQDLGLRQHGIFRAPIIEGLRAKADRRPELVRRAEDHLSRQD